MENVLTAVINSLLNQGIAGTVIAVLVYVVYYLYSKNEKLQDQRIEELRGLMAAINANTVVMERTNETVDKFLEVTARGSTK